MKTLKALKITSILQALYCIYCFVPIVFLAVGDGSEVALCTDIGISLFCFTIINPTVPISFILNISIFLKERKESETKNIIGKRWVWIYVWPIITTIFFIISGLLFIKYTGGV